MRNMRLKSLTDHTDPLSFTVDDAQRPSHLCGSGTERRSNILLRRCVYGRTRIRHHGIKIRLNGRKRRAGNFFHDAASSCEEIDLVEISLAAQEVPPDDDQGISIFCFASMNM